MERKFFDTVDGRDVFIHTMKRGEIEVELCDFGARIHALRVRGRDIALGCDSVKAYLDGNRYMGATVGRVANRIAAGKFTLGGKEYRLDQNSKENCLHGGFNGYDKRVFNWQASGNEVCFSLKSEDGDQGFPGALDLEVRYMLGDHELLVGFTAASDADTVWAPTNHTFFNFSGRLDTIYDTELKINADAYTPVDGTLIPTGNLRAVRGTAFDFTDYKKIGQDISASDEQLKVVAGGYDHNFVLRGEHAASVKYNGIQMDIYTDMPGLQFYSGNFMANKRTRKGTCAKHTAFCLEPQYFPNAVNIEKFETPLLKKGKTKTHYIKYSWK